MYCQRQIKCGNANWTMYIRKNESVFGGWSKPDYAIWDTYISQHRDLSINNTASIKPMYYLSDTQAYDEVCAKNNCIVFCLCFILESISLIDWLNGKKIYFSPIGNDPFYT